MNQPDEQNSEEEINGIKLSSVNNLTQAIKDDSKQGLTHWKVSSRWQHGTRTDHHVEGCRIGSEEVQREFVIKVDEPFQLAGSNEYANPQEHLLAAMNACMMVGYKVTAAMSGINLTKLEIITQGEVDLRGFFDLDDSVARGYESLEQEVHISGSATTEQFEKMHHNVIRNSVNYFNITHAIPVKTKLVVGN